MHGFSRHLLVSGLKIHPESKGVAIADNERNPGQARGSGLGRCNLEHLQANTSTAVGWQRCEHLNQIRRCGFGLESQHRAEERGLVFFWPGGASNRVAMNTGHRSTARIEYDPLVSLGSFGLQASSLLSRRKSGGGVFCPIALGRTVRRQQGKLHKCIRIVGRSVSKPFRQDQFYRPPPSGVATMIRQTALSPKKDPSGSGSARMPTFVQRAALSDSGGWPTYPRSACAESRAEPAAHRWAVPTARRFGR